VAPSRTIVIAGAGIGGLTASLALAARGFDVIVLERETALQEVGAGLQLSPNASRILIELGLEPLLMPRLVAPDAVIVMSVRAARPIARIPLADAGQRYGAPYWLLRRPDLQAALLFKVSEHPRIELRLGAPVEDFKTDADGITVTARTMDGPRQQTALALIGADGVWSAVRGRLFPDLRPAFTGRIAWRGTCEAASLPGFDNRCVQLWMGPNAHLVVYPLAEGRQVNLVAVTTGEWDRPGWSEPGEAAEVAQAFAAWPDAARRLIGAIESWRRWALFGMPDGGVWGQGRVALLGDAAHAMLPFAAQGAGMAIEDAAVLADILAQDGDVATALARYGQTRSPRVGRVQRTARRNGEVYHLRGPMALARDQVIGWLGGPALLSRQDWIYGWRR
jgi:salicylate hydroxylase